jgi:electron transfer flavoprotein alpha subunit
MSVLILVEASEGKIKKVTFETASYAKKIADSLGTTVTAVSINIHHVSELGKYGVSKVLKVNDDTLKTFNAKTYTSILKQAAIKENATFVVFSSTTDSIYMAASTAVDLDATYASNVVGLPINMNPFQVKRTVFSNKAFTVTEMNSNKKVISIAKNSFGLVESPVDLVEENFEIQLHNSDLSMEVLSSEKGTGKVTIADAEVVVSGGRGLKGPENWGLIEDLASVLGAATACSKPVSDLGWRPHSEHVGQTGKPVASNLYIAVGVSGAIQHIAGINSSKVKVVINTDPEAPFFKVADYGIVGDAFDILPKLTQKLKEFKAQNS